MPTNSNSNVIERNSWKYKLLMMKRKWKLMRNQSLNKSQIMKTTQKKDHVAKADQRVLKEVVLEVAVLHIAQEVVLAGLEVDPVDLEVVPVDLDLGLVVVLEVEVLLLVGLEVALVGPEVNRVNLLVALVAVLGVEVVHVVQKAVLLNHIILVRDLDPGAVLVVLKVDPDVLEADHVVVPEVEVQLHVVREVLLNVQEVGVDLANLGLLHLQVIVDLIVNNSKIVIF